MLRTPALGGSISVAQIKLLWGGRKGNQTIYKSTTKRAGNLNIKDYDLVRKSICQVKKFSVLLCIGRCRRLGLLTSFLSYASQLSGARILFFFFFFFLNSHIPLSPPSSSASTMLGRPASAGSQVSFFPFESLHSRLEAGNGWRLFHPC